MAAVTVHSDSGAQEEKIRHRFYPLVRYSCPLSAGDLHALLCLRLYSWCIFEERCTPSPPTPPPFFISRKTFQKNENGYKSDRLSHTISWKQMIKKIWCNETTCMLWILLLIYQDSTLIWIILIHGPHHWMQSLFLDVWCCWIEW